MAARLTDRQKKFQSTPPVWGATATKKELYLQARISIHAPRVGGDNPSQGKRPVRYQISIHAPRVGGDEENPGGLGKSPDISIHAPRVGGDSCTAVWKQPYLIFQSTPPVWGATWSSRRQLTIWTAFQSTPPVWGATNTRQIQRVEHGISIHAPRVGGDSSKWVTAI